MSGFGTLGKIIAKGGGDAIRKILPKTSRDYYDQFDPQTYYHATMEDIDVFNPNRGFEDDGTSRGATYFSSSPEYVNSYLDEFFDITNPNQYETGARIYPVKIKTKDLFDYQNKDHKNKLKNQLIEDFSEESQAMNVFEEVKEGYWVDLENKDDVRSLYAKFDPKQAKSGEILASIVPYASVGTIGALAGLEEGT